MEPVPSDQALMQAIARGEMAAFEKLVLRYQESAWRTAYRMLGCHQTAEDVAQEAFLKVFEAADRYRPTAAFRTYLCRIVVRACLDQLRKGRPVAADNLVPADGQPFPEQRAAHAEQARAVQEAISRLPPKQRTAVVLRYYEGLSGREIAVAMDTSVKAVERLLARGRARLEGLLRALFRE
jgi:RNA polymerase sigma-70 factor (ECF subfamily)